MSVLNPLPESMMRSNLKRYCLFLLLFLFIWAFIYLPILYSLHHPMREVSWMIEQRYLPQYILPQNNTNILNPRNYCNPMRKVYLNLVIIVCSAIPNTQARKAIRDTWGKYSSIKSGVRVYFLVGSTLNENLDKNLTRENEIFGDIIQESFLDSYNNLTIKTIMMLKWVTNNCQRVKYIMKTDDDMFVNVPNLLSYLNKNGTQNLLAGCLISKAKPVLNKKSKWYVPNEVYEKSFYPNYLSGTGYVMSRSLVKPLYKIALDTPFFYLEDIFLTGICAEKLGVERINNEGFKFFKRKNYPCIYKSAITAHHIAPRDFYKIWINVTNVKIKCKPVKSKPAKIINNKIKIKT